MLPLKIRRCYKGVINYVRRYRCNCFHIATQTTQGYLLVSQLHSRITINYRRHIPPHILETDQPEYTIHLKADGCLCVLITGSSIVFSESAYETYTISMFFSITCCSYYVVLTNDLSNNIIIQCKHSHFPVPFH